MITFEVLGLIPGSTPKVVASLEATGDRFPVVVPHAAEAAWQAGTVRCTCQVQPPGTTSFPLTLEAKYIDHHFPQFQLFFVPTDPPGSSEAGLHLRVFGFS